MKDNDQDLTEQSYSFVLKRIQLLEKKLEIVAKKEDNDKYDFDISLKISVDYDRHLSLHMFGVKVKYKPENKELASISLVCVFEINNFNNLINADGMGNKPLPKGLLNLLNTVVVGTMRGVMFSEFRGTALDNVVLPVLDPSKFERG